MDLIKNKLAALSSLVTEITNSSNERKFEDYDFIDKNLKSLNHDITSKFPIRNLEDLNDIESRIKTCPDSRATLVCLF